MQTLTIVRMIDAGMDEQKVEAMLTPQTQPALADDDEYPSLGGMPAAPAQAHVQPPPAQPRPPQPQQVASRGNSSLHR